MEIQGLYFIKAQHPDGTIYMKVGKSNDPERRMIELQKEFKFSHGELLGFINQGAQLEKSIHRTLRGFNFFGWSREWFQYRQADHVMQWLDFWEPDFKIFKDHKLPLIKVGEVRSLWLKFMNEHDYSGDDTPDTIHWRFYCALPTHIDLGYNPICQNSGGWYRSNYDISAVNCPHCLEIHRRFGNAFGDVYDFRTYIDA